MKFGIWLCLDIIQVKYDFHWVLPTFTSLIVSCKNWVSKLFSGVFCDIDLKLILWICRNVIQFEFCLVWQTFSLSYCPLLKFGIPIFSLLSFVILSWYLVYEFVLANTDHIYDYYRVWPTVIWVLSLCYNEVILTIFFRFWRYWHQMWYINLHGHTTCTAICSFPSFNSFGRGHVFLQLYTFKMLVYLNFESLQEDIAVSHRYQQWSIKKNSTNILHQLTLFQQVHPT